jgi:integrase
LHIAKSCAGVLRFYDLRHAYATWLVDDGVPVNMVQRVMLTIDSDHSHEDRLRTFD